MQRFVGSLSSLMKASSLSGSGGNSLCTMGLRNFSQVNSVIGKSNAERYLETELIRSDQRRKREVGNSKEKNQEFKQVPVDKHITNPEAYSKFLKLNLMGPICKATSHFLNFETPTQIQQEVVPKALKSHHIVASAETGTGKTAAYGLPILQKLLTRKIRGELPLEPGVIHSLILCPTKELAEQVAEHFKSYVKHTIEVLEHEGKFTNIDIKTGLIFGGVSRTGQLRELKNGLDVLIATPGRLVELLKSGEDFTLDRVKYFCLDECDRMLNMGFLPELKTIYNYLPKPNESKDNMQVFMFSATLTKDVEDLVCRFAPTHKLINLNQEFSIPDTIKHVKYFVSKNEMKFKLLLYLLQRKGSLRNKKVLVFCRTREKVERLAENLKNRGYKVIGIHKKKSIAFRTSAIKSFSRPDNEECQILISTDVLARGIDVPELPFVINYDVPAKPEDYIHRVGRTGRAGQEGMAFSFISKTPTLIRVGGRLVELNEEHFIKSVEQFMAKRIEQRKVPGPWSDPYIEKLDEEMKKVEGLSKKKALEILVKKKEKNNPEDEDSHMVSKLSDSYNKLKQKVEQTKTLTESDLKYAPTLRHFKEGRYEDVMKEFDMKRAVKEGAIKRVAPTKARKGKKKPKKFVYQF